MNVHAAKASLSRSIPRRDAYDPGYVETESSRRIEASKPRNISLNRRQGMCGGSRGNVGWADGMDMSVRGKVHRQFGRNSDNSKALIKGFPTTSDGRGSDRLSMRYGGSKSSGHHVGGDEKRAPTQYD